MMEGYSYYRQVSVLIPAGSTQTQFSFTDQPDIRYARIQNMEVVLNSDLSTGYPNQVAILADADANKVQFVFETNDPDDYKALKGSTGRFQGTLQTIKGISASQLHRMQNANTNNASFVRSLFPFFNTYVIWEKSFIVLPTGGLAPGTDVLVVLGVWYTFRTKDGKYIDRNRGGIDEEYAKAQTGR